MDLSKINEKMRFDVGGTGSEEDFMEVMPLGAGSEVGRSCCVIRYKGKTVMFDCGVHPAYSGLASLPFFDDFEMETVDLALITHFHLDHCAGLPYLLEKTNFNPDARIFMTHPTKAIYKALLSDFVRVSHSSTGDENLYNEQDILKTMKRIESMDYHQEMNVNGIRFWSYNAGHVLGAAMFMVEIAGVRVLYTGDFSRQEDRHLKEAELPPLKPDILIVESTYGVQVHEPRRLRETRFTQKVAAIVRRGGRVLLPVFALGRAQELLLILDEFWEAHPDLQDVPIYYASALAKRCMSVYQTYINMMNDNVRKRSDIENPFDFKYVSNLRSMDHFDDSGPCVVMASPGMLQSGLSRQLFEKWCTDKRNGVVLLGYAVDGTLAKHIMTEPSTINRLDGREVPLRCSIDYITFSAHSDFLQTSNFIDLAKPNNIILVHGESNEMGRLRAALDLKYNKGATEKNVKIFTPKNCQTVKLEFRGQKIGKAIGVLPKRGPEDGTLVSGVMIRQDFNHTLIAADDIPKYTNLKVSRIGQRLLIPIERPIKDILSELSQMFQSIRPEKSESDKEEAFVIGDAVNLEFDRTANTLTIKWRSNRATDLLAEAISAVCMTKNNNDAKRTEVKEEVNEEKEKLEIKFDEEYFANALLVTRQMLAARFGPIMVDKDDDQKTRFVVDLFDVVINHKNNHVECEDEGIKERVRMSLKRIHASVFPIPDYYCDCCAC